MKKFGILAMTLVLTAALFVGCGCTNTKMDNASTPTGMTETMPTIVTTEPTTRPTTIPTVPTTLPDATILPTGSEPTTGTDESGLQETSGASGTVRGRERGMLPHGGK